MTTTTATGTPRRRARDDIDADWQPDNATDSTAVSEAVSDDADAVPAARRRGRPSHRDRRYLPPYPWAPRTPCGHCGAMIWRAERNLCCHGGAHVLTDDHNPPLTPEYEAFLRSPGLGDSSRTINQYCSFVALCASPEAAVGGTGLRPPLSQPCVYYLHGHTYHRYFPIGQDGPIQRALLPPQFIYDPVTQTAALDARGVNLLAAARAQLRRTHPLYRCPRIRGIMDVLRRAPDPRDAVTPSPVTRHRGS
jgi:hypothetical protein